MNFLIVQRLLPHMYQLLAAAVVNWPAWWPLNKTVQITCERRAFPFGQCSFFGSLREPLSETCKERQFPCQPVNNKSQQCKPPRLEDKQTKATAEGHPFQFVELTEQLHW